MTDELGLCPVTTAVYANGLNRGINGGRICWAIKGKLDRSDSHCSSCGFFNLLEMEETENQVPLS
jgi:hypothetical protein